MRRARKHALFLAAALLTLLLTVGTSLPAAGATPATGANKLTSALANALATGTDQQVPVIVRFNRPLDSVDWAELEQTSNGPVAAVHRLGAVQAAVLTLPAGRIHALARSPQVERLEEDAPLQLNLAGATQWFGSDQARSSFGVDGTGVTIAVLDTGIDATHADLAGKVVAWNDLIGGRTVPYDDHGHGTHVAGIAAGSGAADARYQGVAPGADLAGIKVCSADGYCSTSAAAAGLQWAIDNRSRYNIRVVNLSFGGSTSSDGKDTLSSMVNAAAANGIVAVVSAGNAGPAVRTIGSPAAAADAITVGNMIDVSRSGFAPVSWSSRGPTADGRVKPDVMAPGYSIWAPKAGSGTGYVSMSGTSMASPFVAGTAALMLQANPGLSVPQVKAQLLGTAIDWGPQGPDSEYGHGRLDAYAAVSAAAGHSGSGNIAAPGHVAFTGSLNGPGARVDHQVDITSTSFPMAITLLQPDWSGAGLPNFTVELYDPAGKLLGSSSTDARQKQLIRNPPSTGTYRLSLISQSGSGRYYLDVSAGRGEAAPPPPPPPSPPAVSLVSPAGGSTLSGTMTIQARVEAPGGIAGVTWSLSGAPASPMTLNTASGLWEAAWNTTALADGAYTITVKATDTAGQTATASASITTANGPPAAWSSGDLESQTWTLNGQEAARDYSVAAPPHPPVAATVTFTVSAYSAAGSNATDRIDPYLELWLLKDGGSTLVTTLVPAGTGRYQVNLNQPAALTGSLTLQVRALSLDKKGKQSDRISINEVTVATTY